MTGMNRRWLMVFLVPSLAGAVAGGCQQAQFKPEQPPPDVRYEAPIARVVKDYEELPGRTDAIVKVQVRSRVSGYMTNSYFKDGTYVEKDAKLFEIDTRPFTADRDRAKGTVDQLEAHLHRAEKSYNRAKNLLARGSVSPEEYDQYEADYKETAATLEVAKANLRLAELNMEWTEVQSPCSGLLSRRLVDPGNLVKADETILTSIVSLDPLYVYFDPADSTMLKIRRLIQQRRARNESEHDVPVKIFLADEDEKKDLPHQGTIDFYDNQVDVNTGTMQFRAKLRNVDHFIAPGLFVRVRLPIGDDHPAVMIREQALERDQDRKKVWLLGYDLRLMSSLEQVSEIPTEDENDCELRLMSSVKHVSEIPRVGKDLKIVAAVGDVLHIRLFKGDGTMVLDTDEKRLTKPARQIADLKKRIEGLWPPHKLTPSEKGGVITAVTAIVGHARSNLVVVADVKDVLHFRFFDSHGKMVVDTDEKRLTKQAPQLQELRKQLKEKEFGPDRELPGSEKIELTGIEKMRFVTAVASIVGHTAFLTRKDATAKADLLMEAIGSGIAVPRYVSAGVARDGYLEIKEGIEPDDLVVVEGLQKLGPGIVVTYKPANPDSLATPENARPEEKAGPVAAALGPANNPTSAQVNATRLSEPASQVGQVFRRGEIPSRSPVPAGSSPRQTQRPPRGPRAAH